MVLTVTAEPLAGPLSPLTADPLCASHAKQQSVRASEQCNRTLSRAENKCQGVRLLQVVPVFAGGLDFSAPVKKFFYDPIYKSTAFVDCIVSLTG